MEIKDIQFGPNGVVIDQASTEADTSEKKAHSEPSKMWRRLPYIGFGVTLLLVWAASHIIGPFALLLISLPAAIYFVASQ